MLVEMRRGRPAEGGRVGMVVGRRNANDAWGGSMPMLTAARSYSVESARQVL